EKVLHRAVKEGVPFFQAMNSALAHKEITAKAATALQQFEGQVKHWHHEFQQTSLSLADHTRKLIEKLHYRDEIDRLYNEPAQKQTRLESIDQLIDSLDDYTRRTARPRLREFLDEIALNDRDE